MRTFPHGETITLHRRVARRDGSGQLVTDAYGRVQYDDETESISRVAVWARSSTETLQGQERTSAGYVVALPDGVLLDAVDAITWRGKSYEVQGEVELLTNPMTGTHANTVVINRVEG